MQCFVAIIEQLHYLNCNYTHHELDTSVPVMHIVPSFVIFHIALDERLRTMASSISAGFCMSVISTYLAVTLVQAWPTYSLQAASSPCNEFMWN